MSVHPTTGERGPLPQCTFHPDTKAGDVVIFSGMGTVSYDACGINRPF